MATITLLPRVNGFYHIYNRGIDGCDLFLERTNYEHFLRLYDRHISPVAETYAWVLMKNHFHFLIRVLPTPDPNLPGSCSRNLEGFSGSRNPVSQAFSNLFNAYTKAFNKKYDRTGSLFEKNFHRIEVDNENYFRQLVVYIHSNPVHHGFTDDFRDYPWSSYGSVVSARPTNLQHPKLLGWFNDKGDFLDVHNKKIDVQLIRHLVIE